MLGQSIQNSLQVPANFIAKDSVKRFMLSREPGYKPYIQLQLAAMLRDSTWISVSLADTTGSIITGTGPAKAIAADPFTFIRDKKDSVQIGKMLQIGEAVYYPVIGRVVADHKHAGYLVIWRQLRSSQKNIE